MTETKQIKDPVHGYIPIRDDFVKKIIDHRLFQRLRYIRQLTATHMVYPSANHTRFEHSIGVFYLAKRAFRSLERKGDLDSLNKDRINELRRTVLAAALLHDIGHPPLAHCGEDFLDNSSIIDGLRETKFFERLEDTQRITENAFEGPGAHELLSCLIIQRHFAEKLGELDIDPGEVCAHVLGTSIVANEEDEWQWAVGADLVSSTFDVDRLDYIVRDNFMTGADVANVDTDRMVRSYTTVDESLALSDNALSAIGNYLDGRLHIQEWITHHHKVVYSGALLTAAIKELENETGQTIISTDKIIDDGIDDTYVMEELRKCADQNPESQVAKLYETFRSRRYPMSCWKHRAEYRTLFDEEVLFEVDKAVDNNPVDVEKMLATALNIPETDIWVEDASVAEYDTEDLRQIFIEIRNESANSIKKSSVQRLGIYNNPSMSGYTPYIFIDRDHESEISQLDVVNAIQDNLST